MNRRRRAALLLGLALIVGALAASDIAQRENALKTRLSPLEDIVVAKNDLKKGKLLSASDLAVRRIPARYAPIGVASTRSELLGARLAFPIARGSVFVPHSLMPDGQGGGSTARRGERAVEVLALGSAELISAGVRVDALVTRDREGDRVGATLALEDVEVMSVRAAEKSESGSHAGLQRVAATLRVTPRQAVYLAAAQAGGQELRLLARAPDDRQHSGGIKVGSEE